MAWLTSRMPLGGLRTEALRVFAENYLSGPATGTVPTSHGRPVEIHIAATPAALAGLTDTPAEVPGVRRRRAQPT